MAETFRLIDNNGTVLTDFLGSDFYQSGDWSLREARPGERTVDESISLLKDDTASNLRTDLTGLSDALQLAGEYFDNRLVDNWVWWQWVTDGESDKRALVYPGGVVEVPGQRRNGLSPWLRNQIASPICKFPRHRHFEATSAYTPTPTTNQVLVGSKLSLTGAGTAEGRVSLLRLTLKYAVSDSDPIQRIWIGMREEGAGTSDFDPVVDLHDGVARTEASKTTSVTGAYGTHCIDVTPTSLNDDQLRATITVGQAAGAGDETHYIGRYLVLLRYAATASAQFAIRLGMAQTATGNTAYKPAVYVTGAGTTTWNMIPIGVVDLPPMPNKLGWSTNEIAVQMFKINAEMLSGTISSDILRLNTLTLVPANRILTITNARWFDALDESWLNAVCLPDDSFFGFTSNWTSPSGPEVPIDSVDVNAQNFFVPRDDGIMVIAGARGATSDLNDDVDVDVEIYRRWRSYR